MDFERIALLLNVIHSTIDVPHTANIRRLAQDEIAAWNAGAIKADPDQPELPYEKLERKL